jgi:hypothetical protein
VRREYGIFIESLALCSAGGGDRYRFAAVEQEEEERERINRRDRGVRREGEGSE